MKTINMDKAYSGASQYLRNGGSLKKNVDGRIITINAQRIDVDNGIVKMFIETDEYQNAFSALSKEYPIYKDEKGYYTRSSEFYEGLKKLPTSIFATLDTVNKKIVDSQGDEGDVQDLLIATSNIFGYYDFN